MSDGMLMFDLVTGKYFLIDEEEVREKIDRVNCMLSDELNQPVTLKELLDNLPKINP